jgi:hypothetical protein
MKWLQGLSAAVLVLVAIAGCSDKSDVVKDKGSYSPIITGIHNATGEPAIRGIPNQLELQVTNVNGLPLTIHWSASSGTLTDSTGETAVWTPPDEIGTHTITVSLTATDGVASFFKSTTYSVYVENEYTRWTRSDAVQFDPAPTTSDDVLYAEFRNNITGEGDVYRVSSPLGVPEQLSFNFFNVSSPTPRSDEAQVAFAGRRRSNDSTSIWLAPWGGADTLTASRLTQANNQLQRFLAHPRFAWNGGFLLYASDSGLVTNPKLWYRDVSAPVAPVAVVSPQAGTSVHFNVYLPANWGGGGAINAPPDSVITPSIFLFNRVGQRLRGVYKFDTPSFGEPPPTTDQAWIPDSTITEPDWSSNGSWIVYARRAPGANDRDLWILPTNATSLAEAVQVTRGPADDSHPRFSKDGTTIYFVSNRQDLYGLNGVFGIERRGTNIWSVRRFDLP